MGIRVGIGSVLLCAAVATAAAPAGAAVQPLFQPYTATTTGSWPEAVAIGDVTGDGRADVVMTTSFYFDDANDYKLFVFRQQSDGTLAAPVKYATGSTYNEGAESVAIGDITGDGRNDVVVGLEGLGIQLFAETTGGKLDTPTLTPTADSFQIRLGHFNDDTALDVAGIGWSTGTASVFLNLLGALGIPTTFSAPHGGWNDLEAADVTGDGRADIVVMSGQGLGPDVSVVPQLAIGGFGAPVSYNMPDTTWRPNGIGVGDVTGDGKTDVVVGFGGNKPTSKVIVLPQSGGLLGAPVIYDSYDIPEATEVADLDFDGKADVVTAHGGWNTLGVYRQQANGTLAAEEKYPLPYATSYNPHGMAIGDVNGDRSPDVVLADYNHGLVVLPNTSTPPIPPPADIAVTATRSTKLVRGAKPYSFTVKVTNNGPNSTDTHLNTTVTGPTKPITASDARCTVTGGNVACAFGVLAKGQSVTVKLAGVATGVKGTLVLQATGSGAGVDPKPANNAATQKIATAK